MGEVVDESLVAQLEGQIISRKRFYASLRQNAEGAAIYAPTQAEEVLSIAALLLDHIKRLEARIVELERSSRRVDPYFWKPVR